MAYIVKTRFADLEDGKRLYLAGETFPRDGLIVNEKRLKKLAGSDNLTGKPLIEYIPDTQDGEEDKEEKVVRKRVRKDA